MVRIISIAKAFTEVELVEIAMALELFMLQMYSIF